MTGLNEKENKEKLKRGIKIEVKMKKKNTERTKKDKLKEKN